ncbi:hypothetical protein GLYMA_10G175350v4 [Glycine max]|nr:hypothetical protein GLYMA_10G175350v4 [Glycine max]KAH1138789.1 hypothetical protein GYH30_028312 [Glycine max]
MKKLEMGQHQSSFLHSLIRIIILQLYAELITKLWRMPLLSFDKIAMPIDAKDRGIGDSQQLHRYQIH